MGLDVTQYDEPVRACGADDDWFDQLNLDPSAHPVAMGTRALSERPWLVVDDRRDRELALKSELLNQRRDQVLWLTESSRAAAAAVERSVGLALRSAVEAKPADGGDEPDRHPLEAAARLTQEDLILLERRDDRWYLDASCLCFPTRWHLLDKVGRPIGEVHAPVGGYADRIAQKVTRLFDRLGPNPVWRRNWFLMTNPALHQPDRPETETIIAADRVHHDLYIRSERQTLRQVTPGWLLFTVRIQQARLGDLLTGPERVDRFLTWTREVSDDFGRRRHLEPDQRRELVTALT